MHLPREGNGNPLQYSCLENPMDGGTQQATAHGVAKSQTRLSDFTFTKSRITASPPAGCLPHYKEFDLLDPWVGKVPWRRKWQPIPVLLPRKFHGWRSLVGYSPWGHKGSDTTERRHFHQPLLVQRKEKMSVLS